MRRTMLLLLALPAAAAALLVPAGAQPVTRPNILLITIDTLRADRLGVYGHEGARTPALDRLARDGVRFTDATAHSPLTHPSHAAILTGQYPHRFGIRVNGATPLPESAVTIAERLEQAGYETAAFVAAAVLDRAYGLAQGFGVYDDAFRSDPGQYVALSDLRRSADAVAQAAGGWLGDRRRSPWFGWVHFYDPHLPYDAPEKFQALLKGSPYDAEVAYVDAAIASLLEHVDRSRTVILVTADHGESLGDHGESDHGYFIYDAVLRVPFIVAGPGLSPGVVDEQVRGVDVAPTIAELAGLEAPKGLDGESLVPLLRGGRREDVPVSYAESWYPRLHFGWSELRAVRVGEWKYIAAPRPELYDLRVDPGEQKNLIQDRAMVAGRLAAELRRLGPPAGEAARRETQPDPEAVRRLQALGYVGAFAPVTATTATVDPKDRVVEYQEYRRLFNQALTALHRNRPAEAVPLFKQILTANVRAFEAHLYLGNAYAALGQHEAALGEYDAVRMLNPDLATVEFEAAKVLAMRGETTAAVERARVGLAREPHSFYGQYTLGVIHQMAKQPGEAAEAFTRAVALNAQEPRARWNLAQAAMALGRAALAEEQLEQVIALGYRVAQAEYNLGVIAARAGDRAEAARRFQRALDADPKFDPARKALAGLK